MIPKLRFKDDNGNDFPAWNTTVRLEEISAFITKGATPTTYGFEWQIKGIYFFRNDCIKNNIFVYGDYSYISEEANEFLKRSEIRGDDIVIAITGDIGKVGLVPRKIKKANINQHLARIRIVKDAIPYFVYSCIHVYAQKVMLMRNICFGISKVVVGIDSYMKMGHRMVQDTIELV